MNRHNPLLRRTVLGVLALSTLPAVAQETPQPGRTIETIMVTAQKREQSLQDVPIVVTALSEHLLQDTGVSDIKDLQVLTPGLIVVSSSNESTTMARIRGIGTFSENVGLESSVGVVIDGVYRPRNGVAFGDLGELERIEVLKGPQGTLFGKNTSAGVINVMSKRPSFDFESQLELTGGNHGVKEGSASINGPLTKSLAGRLYVAARERDGFLDVSTGEGPRTETEDNDRNMKTARGQLLLQPSEAVDIRLIGDYTERDEHCCAAVQTITGPRGPLVDSLATDAGVMNPADPFARDAFTNRSTRQQVDDMGIAAEINWRLKALGGATVTSITAWRDWESMAGQDTDISSADIIYRDDDGDFASAFEQLSEEVRLAGEAGRLNWLVGAFYASEDLTSHNGQIYGNDFRAYFAGVSSPAVINSLPANAYPANLGSRDLYEQEASTWALFTNNNIRLTDALELTLGARYTNESKDLDTQYRNDHGGVGCAALRARTLPAGFYSLGCAAFADPVFNSVDTRQSIDESEWSGTAKLAYRFTDQAMAYASYARGYKAGGFNLDRERLGTPPFATPTSVIVDSDTSFDPEIADSYELGVKTQWLDSSLLLNATAFYQEYSGYQLNAFNGVSLVVSSIPKVTSEGVDADFVWFTPLEQLSLQGGVTYADTKYGDFVPPPSAPLLPNNQMSFAPQWSGSLSVTFEQPIGSHWIWRTNVGAKYTSEYNAGSDLNPVKNQDALTLLNARTGFGAADQRWMVEAWAQNLTDENYYQIVFDQPLQTGSYTAWLGAPRLYGVTARFKF